MASEHDTWTTNLNGNLELRRGGMTRGFVVGSFWRTDNQPTAMGTEKDAETAKIALIAACDAHDDLSVLPWQDRPARAASEVVVSREDLGQRVAACRRVWRWLPNTPTWDALVVSVTDGEITEVVFNGELVDARMMTDAEADEATGPFVYNTTGALPDMHSPAAQGNALALIAEHNTRRSILAALGDAHTKVGRGLSFPEALVELIEECEAAHGDV